MYDILQLNDMIVPELLDIAEQLKIPNTKKMDKQELVYKILDSQAIVGAKTSGDAKTKQRKRIIKATTGNTTEEAIVESSDKKPIKKVHAKKEEKPVPKKPRKKDEVEEPAIDDFTPSDEADEDGEMPEESESESTELISTDDNGNGMGSEVNQAQP